MSKSDKSAPFSLLSNNRIENAELLIKNRNFDPKTRTLKKRGNDEDVEMEDTVEKNVEGLAEQIIEEDTEKRAQELVRTLVALSNGISLRNMRTGSFQHCTQESELGSKAGDGEKTC